MQPRRRTPALAALVAIAVAAAAGGASAATGFDRTTTEPATRVVVSAAPASLRLDGIGPLKLGMTRAAALRTGWLAQPRSGCPLGGKPYPIDYRLSGPRAPAVVQGTAEFQRGRLRVLSFTRGVRTAAGVVVGETTSGGMAYRYRARGYRVRSSYVDTFQGRFVTVEQRGRQVIGGFAEGRTVTLLGIPAVPVCE